MYLIDIHVQFIGNEQERAMFRIDRKRLLITIPPKTPDAAERRLKIVRYEYDEATNKDSPRTLYEGIVNYIPDQGKQETTKTSLDRMFLNESFL